MHKDSSKGFETSTLNTSAEIRRTAMRKKTMRADVHTRYRSLKQVIKAVELSMSWTPGNVVEYLSPM